MRAREFLQEQSMPKVWPIQIPPNDIAACKKLILTYMDDPEAEYYSDDERVFDIDEWVNSLSNNTIKHEAIHALQNKNIPDIYQGLSSLEYMNSIDWRDSEALIDDPNYQMYLSRAPEIMAFAYDAANGIDTKEIIAKYKKIGGAVEYQFKHYYNQYSNSEMVDEMALPADWDAEALGHDKTFKSRLDYVLQRAPRLGGGSSRVAFVIPDNGRETVLKVAKNKKGMAQNEAEVDILDDGYLGKLDIVIPLVDYDRKNPTPTWIQTEKANKVSQQKLAKMLHCDKSSWGMPFFLYAVYNIIGRKSKYMPTLDQIKQDMLDNGSSEKDLEIFMDYVDKVAILVSSSTLLPDDLSRAENWGEYQGNPVIIDLGYTAPVHDLYWKR